MDMKWASSRLSESDTSSDSSSSSSSGSSSRSSSSGRSSSSSSVIEFKPTRSGLEKYVITKPSDTNEMIKFDLNETEIEVPGVVQRKPKMTKENMKKIASKKTTSAKKVVKTSSTPRKDKSTARIESKAIEEVAKYTPEEVLQLVVKQDLIYYLVKCAKDDPNAADKYKVDVMSHDEMKVQWPHLLIRYFESKVKFHNVPARDLENESNAMN